MRLSIIIPVYNERNTIVELLKRVEEVELPEEGKKITWRDGIAAIYHIIKYNLFG